MGHYSVNTQNVNHPALERLVRTIRLPVVQPSGFLSQKEHEQMIVRIHQMAEKSENLSLRPDGATLNIMGTHSDGRFYVIGSVGYNLNESLTDWFTGRISKKSLDEFLKRHPNVARGRVKELLFEKPPRSEMHGLCTYSVEGARNELKNLGLTDFTLAFNAYKSRSIPLLYATRNPDATFYFG